MEGTRPSQRPVAPRSREGAAAYTFRRIPEVMSASSRLIASPALAMAWLRDGSEQITTGGAECAAIEVRPDRGGGGFAECGLREGLWPEPGDLCFAAGEQAGGGGGDCAAEGRGGGGLRSEAGRHGA